MLVFRPSIPSDLPRIMEIWRAAVDATHSIELNSVKILFLNDSLIFHCTKTGVQTVKFYVF